MDALVSGLPVAAEHAQVLERLRQLTAWQQAQQERLRKHQEEQIARLRGDHDASGSPQLVPCVTQREQVCAASISTRPELQSLSLSSTVGSRDCVWTSYQPAPDNAQYDFMSPEDPLPSTNTVAMLEGKEGEGLSDSGMETGEQGSEEETAQRRVSSGSGDSQLTGIEQRRVKDSGQTADRPIHPGVGKQGVISVYCS